MTQHAERKGVVAGFAAYGFWGFVPIYWKILGEVPVWQLLLHRMTWSLLFVSLLLTLRQDWSWLQPTLADRRNLWRFAASAVLLAINWFVYIWGVNSGYIVETSLGYFINPLISVLFGVVFLGERMRRGQWLAVGIATAGVVYLTVRYGSLPWIALTLAVSFGVYGLLKKQARVGAVQGLTLETAVLAGPAALALVYLGITGQGAFITEGAGTSLLLVGTGAVTAIPLILFAASARLIPLSMLGILQYLAPTLQLLIGVLIYGEPFPLERMLGFAFIWTALVIYTAENLRHRQGAQRALRT
jgi:chloramphenicol-sensitive protein RarD